MKDQNRPNINASHYKNFREIVTVYNYKHEINIKLILSLNRLKTALETRRLSK